MENAPNPTRRDLALLRFEVICQIKTLREAGHTLAESLREVSSRPWPGPEGQYYAYRTLETWWYDYARSGYHGLEAKAARTDAGRSRTIDEETGRWIIERIGENPRVPLQVLLRHWKSQGRSLPSASSVYRYLRAKGYDRRALRAGRLETGPQKAFETPAPNLLWMADFACGPHLRSAAGKALATHLCVILDDHSRLIPFAAYYAKADTACFLSTLKEAVLRRGLPVKLYTDQGKPFVNAHVRHVCASLGIRLLHAKPYHAWSKGKVERLIRTIQSDFEQSLRLRSEAERPAGLEELNTALSTWIGAHYHLRPHGSTRQSPHERFNAAEFPIRMIEDPQNIDRLFYTRLERVVRKDGTVTFGGTMWEVDLSLRALKVELRFDPQRLDRVEVWHARAFAGLARRVDLNLNSRTFNKSDNYAR